MRMGKCGCGCGSTCIQILGCNNAGPIAGVGVTIKTSSSGTVVFSGTTNANGEVCGTISATGTFWMILTAPSPSSYPANLYTYTTGQNQYLVKDSTTAYALPVASGYFCCPGFPNPLPQTIYITVCSTTLTLTAAAASGTSFAWAIALPGYVDITSAGVAVDNGTCSWSGYPATTTGTTTLSIGIYCPTSTGALTGLATTTYLGHFNSVTQSYDAFALDPTSCSSNGVCHATPVSFSGSIGSSISMTGTMPSTCAASCFPGITAPPMPCAGDSMTLTN